MGKGIAITTILLLLVGTLVAGVTVYYTYKSISGSPLSEHECRGMMISWCIGCMNSGYSSDATYASPECASKYWGISHSNCDAENDCSAFLPGGGGGGGGDNGDNGIDPICANNLGAKGCYHDFACPNSDYGTEGCTCYDGTDCDAGDNGGNDCCCIC